MLRCTLNNSVVCVYTVTMFYIQGYIPYDIYHTSFCYIAYLQVHCYTTWPSLSGKDIDAVGRQFEPYPYRRIHLHAQAGGALVVSPGVLFPNSRGCSS